MPTHLESMGSVPTPLGALLLPLHRIFLSLCYFPPWNEGPLHTRDWEPVTITLQALSLVEKAEPLQVRFKPTEYVNARWMSSLHGFLHDIEWIMFHGHLDYFQKPLPGGRPNTKPWDHGTPNALNRWFILFYHVWGSTWIDIHWMNLLYLMRLHESRNSSAPFETSMALYMYESMHSSVDRPLRVSSIVWRITNYLFKCYSYKCENELVQVVLIYHKHHSNWAYIYMK